ncbi:MAG TPA: hypothetical protein VGF18_06930 [Candidatus Tumulicola sp.]|jgi:hypothetical protein
MVRIRRLIAALTLLAAAVPAGAGAQALQRLTVQSFTLASDTASPHTGVPFHLTVTLRVRENIGSIGNIELPLLASLDLLGDERQVSAGPGGSIYRETIAVTAHSPGQLTIAPAVLQAIDARDGHAKQYTTNGLSLRVVGAAETTPLVNPPPGSSWRWAIVWVVLWLVVIAVIVAIVVALARRGAVADIRLAPPVIDEAPPLPPRTLHDQLHDALLVLRADPTRLDAVAVRNAVWRAIGADEGETLSAVLRLPQASVEPMRGLLIALERAAFTYDADLPNAIADACTALERNLQ